MWKVCVFCPARCQVRVTENTFCFTHQSATSCRLRRCHRCAIKHKSLKSSAKSPEWMCVAERCHLSQVFVTGRAGRKKMQITYHTPHTSLKLIFRLSVFFFFSFQSVIADWFVLLVISFGGGKSCPGEYK